MNHLHDGHSGGHDLLDHQQLGRELGIYATDPRVGAGLPLWLPHGAIVRGELERLADQEAVRNGCQPVYTPVLAKRELFVTSGHWAKFADEMFPPLPARGGDGEEQGDAPSSGADELVLRPANCPHHAMVYDAVAHSYRDLPVRYRELAPMFRDERSGSLSGLRRVRQINLDDTHVFCTPEQVEAEVRRALESVLRCLKVLGLQIARVHLSVRDDGDGYLGEVAQWQASQAQLARACDALGLGYEVCEGAAAFYGPKIDVEVAGVGGREETLATVQLDLNQPQRFGLRYTDVDGVERHPVMIHCGVLGCMERMVAFLLEVHQGRLPAWLAPVQVVLLPVGADQLRGAQEVARALAPARVQVLSEGSLGSRIRQARTVRAPWIGVIGAREQASGSVAVTTPARSEQDVVPRNRFIARVAEQLESRAPAPQAW